jgi:hypothetical protein
MCEPPGDPTGGRSANPAECVRTGLGDGLAQAMICWDWTRDDIGVARGGDRGDASNKTAAEARGPRMGSRPTFSMAAIRTLRWCSVEAVTEHVLAAFASHESRREGRGHGYILTSVNGRVALASRRVIGTGVS